jgi:SAM-dependent methyltransferase
MDSRSGSDAASPFDGLAEHYDTSFSDSLLGRTLRAAVWRRVQPHLGRARSALDLGCGTGIDTVALATAGLDVMAVDASEEMVRMAKHRCTRHEVVAQIESCDLMSLDTLEECNGPFDLVLSNFGPLNCVNDLGDAMRQIAVRLAPDGILIATIMGRFVPWEWLWMTASGHPGKGFRRLRRGGVPWRSMTVRYYSPSAIRAAAESAGLRIRRLVALGALLPISEAGGWINRKPRLLQVLDRIERRLEAVPPLGWLADHILVEVQHR